MIGPGRILNELRKQKGLLRSRLIYDFKPGAHRKLMRFYRSFVKAGDICFDIGAHTGNHTSAWLKLGANVIAIEPQPLFADLLRRKFTDNQSVKILQLGLADSPGVMKLKINSSNPTISTLSEEWTETIRSYGGTPIWNEEIDTEVISLDDIIALHGIPSFCKIDVEGFEEKILAGLTNAIPALAFEFFPTTPKRTLQCIDRLEQLAEYRYNYSFTEHYHLESKHWMNPHAIKKEIGKYRGKKSGDIYAFRERIVP